LVPYPINIATPTSLFQLSTVALSSPQLQTMDPVQPLLVRWLIVQLRHLDWVSRHHHMALLSNYAVHKTRWKATLTAVKRQMSPCELLDGEGTGTTAQPHDVFVLPDKKRQRQRLITEFSR
jgi:hypothetical protein